MVDPAQTSVTIVGAGLIGLSTALSLHAAGFRDIHIFERVRELEPLGVGITLQRPAMITLRNLGLLPALTKIGSEPYEFVWSDEFNNHISTTVNGAPDTKAASRSFHRGELQMLLLAAVKERLGADHVHVNHSLADYAQTATDVVASFVASDGSPAAVPQRTSHVLIGADGIKSAMRKKLHPAEGAPRWGGSLIWRGAVRRAPPYDGHTMVGQGYGAMWILAYPISPPDEHGNRLVNFAAVERTQPADSPNTEPPEVVSWTAEADKGKLIDKFGAWVTDAGPLSEVIRSIERIWIYPIVDRDPVDKWSDGRVTLVGDAAHPMYPIGGNGASQGVLDGECLTRALVQESDVAAALKAYETERLEPTSKNVLVNREERGIHRVATIVHERAPNGFAHIDDVMSPEEIEAELAFYRVAAGTEAAKAERKAVETEGMAERLGLTPPAGWA